MCNNYAIDKIKRAIITIIALFISKSELKNPTGKIL